MRGFVHCLLFTISAGLPLKNRIKCSGFNRMSPQSEFYQDPAADFGIVTKMSSEDMVIAAMRRGFQGDGDVLNKARVADEMKALMTDLNSKKLLGCTIIIPETDVHCLESDGIDVYKRLETAGAILLSAGDASKSDLNMNARDKACIMGLGASDVNAVASGSAVGAILSSADANPTTINIELSKSFSWVGVTGYQYIDKNMRSWSICGSSLTNVVAIRNSITPFSCSIPINAEKISLKGVKIAVMSSQPIFDIYSKMRCEPCITIALNVAADIFKSLGAEVVKVRNSVSGELNADLNNFDLFLCPASRTASYPPDEMWDVADLNKNFVTSSIPMPLEGQPRIVMPCGIVADEDDGGGMGDDSELVDRIGLPIGMMLVQVANRATSEAADPVQKLFMTALAYEKATRWATEVFAPGVLRADIVEDVENVRETYGIYFVSSLLEFLGKPENKIPS